jgi:ketosteroid isomerase-like protein
VSYKSLLLVVFASALSSLAGCSQAPPPAAPVPDHAADEKTIRDGEAQWVLDFNSRTVDRVLSHYAPDAASMLPDTPLMIGTDAIRAGVKMEFADPNSSLHFHPTKVEIAQSGEIAYSQGVFTYTGTDPKTKKAASQDGNYVEVYKKQPDGSWKAIEDIATEETPLIPLKKK